MDHEKFLNELDLIKIIGAESDAGSQGGTVCNRLYNTLVECLAIESKCIEAKLRVLTAALCFYVELRPQHESISPEADAFGHFLFMESSRLVLGIEFHHLPNSNEFKSSFKSAIATLYNRLHDYAIGQVFLVLDWLMANQWSHPTLVAMMKGDDINADIALAYIRSGEYPELFRLRVEMLMESGCDNFAANLVGWCVQSPLFENDVQLRSTHLSLLFKLSKHEALQAQCYQISCCLGKQILKYSIGRGDDQSFALFFSYNFLLANWLKADVYCCYKELLQLWVSVHHQTNADNEMFVADIYKLTELSSTQPKLLSAIVSTLALLFDQKYADVCSTVALNCVILCSKTPPNKKLDFKTCTEVDVAPILEICQALSGLYVDHAHMQLSCLLTSLYLRPSQSAYQIAESHFKNYLSNNIASDTIPSGVQTCKVDALLKALDALRPPKLHHQFGWEAIAEVMAVRLESSLFNGVVQDAGSSRICMSSERSLLDVDAMMDRSHTGVTLDDIQQVLNGTCMGVNELPLDESALKEITIFLQSEVERDQNHVSTHKPSCSASSYNSIQIKNENNFSSNSSTNDTLMNCTQPTGSLNGFGNTILVTETNLPYLQQFIPNIQNVVQSVQSLMRSNSLGDAKPGDKRELNSMLRTKLQCQFCQHAFQTPQQLEVHVQSACRFAKNGANKLERGKLADDLDSAANKLDYQLTNDPFDAQKLLKGTSILDLASTSSMSCDRCGRTFSKRNDFLIHCNSCKIERKREEIDTSQPCSPAKISKLDLSLSPSSQEMRAEEDSLDHIKQAPVIEMLQLAEHFLRNNVLQQQQQQQQKQLFMQQNQLPLQMLQQKDTSQILSVVSKPPTNDNFDSKEILYEGTRMLQRIEYQCQLCLLAFQEQKMAEHHINISDHKQAPINTYHVFSCEACHMRHRDKQAMRNHILYVCSGRQKTDMQSQFVSTQLHKCPLCWKAFVSDTYLQLHLDTRHPQLTPIARQHIRNFLNDLSCKNNEGAESDFLIPTPSMTFVPSLEELRSAFLQPPQLPSFINSPQQQQQQLHLRSIQSDIASNTSQLSTPKNQTNEMDALADIPDILVSIPKLTQLSCHLNDQLSNHLVDDLNSQLIGQINSHLSNQINEQYSKASTIHHGAELGIKEGTNVTSSEGGAKSARSSKAKGIMYKNVFMQCEGKYFCSICKMDLSSRDSKKNHKQMLCGDPKTVTYSRKYSYLCPYCSAKFPSQKFCRQHQISECLPLVGICTDDLATKELQCPYCPKKYHNLNPLKGHMTQVHQMPKQDTRDLLLKLGYVQLPHTGPQLAQMVSSPANTPRPCDPFFDIEADLAATATDDEEMINQVVSQTSPDMQVIYDDNVFAAESEQTIEGEDEGMQQSPLLSQAASFDDSTTCISTDSPLHPPSLDTNHNSSHRSNSTPDSNQTRLSPLYSSLNSVNVTSTSALSPQSYNGAPSKKKKMKPTTATGINHSGDYFVMMFRNYPILARGVAMCTGCNLQMPATMVAEVERHVLECVQPAEVRRSTLFKCTHCEATFWKAKLCRQHQVESCLPGHGITDTDRLVCPSVICPLCPAKSYNRSGLMSHMKYKHKLDTQGVRDMMDECGIRKQTLDMLANADAVLDRAEDEDEEEDLLVSNIIATSPIASAS